MLGLEWPKVCCCTLSGTLILCNAVSTDRKERQVNAGILSFSDSGPKPRVVTS